MIRYFSWSRMNLMTRYSWRIKRNLIDCWWKPSRKQWSRHHHHHRIQILWYQHHQSWILRLLYHHHHLHHHHPISTTTVRKLIRICCQVRSMVHGTYIYPSVISHPILSRHMIWVVLDEIFSLTIIFALTHIQCFSEWIQWLFNSSYQLIDYF